MAPRSPAEVFSPGEFIRDELDARGWTQGDLAQIREGYQKLETMTFAIAEKLYGSDSPPVEG